ncbi:MAG: outer membrane beta-barrel protein, partial [Elusimicrobiales bacterium]|nr:outer membrane beta-barrel protein [Elusimicrobiales bacterium]
MAANVSFAADNLKGKTDVSVSLFDAVMADGDFENAIGFGIAGTYFVQNNLSLGAEFSMNSNNCSVPGVKKAETNMFGIFAKLYSQSFKIGNTDWNAYGIFGLGTYGYEVKSDAGKGDDRAFGINYGAGLMHYFSDNNLVLNLEIRKHNGFQEDLGNNAGVNRYQKAVYTNYTASIGYRF